MASPLLKAATIITNLQILKPGRREYSIGELSTEIKRETGTINAKRIRVIAMTMEELGYFKTTNDKQYIHSLEPEPKKMLFQTARQIAEDQAKNKKESVEKDAKDIDKLLENIEAD